MDTTTETILQCLDNHLDQSFNDVGKNRMLSGLSTRQLFLASGFTDNDKEERNRFTNLLHQLAEEAKIQRRWLGTPATFIWFSNKCNWRF